MKSSKMSFHHHQHGHQHGHHHQQQHYQSENFCHDQQQYNHGHHQNQHNGVITKKRISSIPFIMSILTLI